MTVDVMTHVVIVSISKCGDYVYKSQNDDELTAFIMSKILLTKWLLTL